MDARLSLKLDPDAIKQIATLTAEQLRSELSKVQECLEQQAREQLRELREMRMVPISAENEYISQPEAVRRLQGRRSVKTLQRMRADGRLKFKIKRRGEAERVYYREGDIESLKRGRLSDRES